MHYLIQVNLYLVIFYLFYSVLLRRETFHQANRFYLILSSIMAFVIPFLQTDWVKSWLVTQEVSEMMAGYEVAAFEVPISAAAGGLNFTFKQYLLALYCMGVVLFTVLFCRDLYRTLQWMNRGSELDEHAYTFFGKVRVGKTLSPFKAIYDHEDVHVRQHHSLDIVLVEVIAILCWWNPVVYLLKREIRLLHEYQADAYAARISGSKAQYAALLLSQKFSVSPDSILGNAFFTHSFLKARIMMLCKRSSEKHALLKYSLVAPVFLGMMVLASASIAGSERLNKLEKISQELIFERSPQVIEVDFVHHSAQAPDESHLDNVKPRVEEVNIVVTDPAKNAEVPAPPKTDEVLIAIIEEDRQPGEEVIFIGTEEPPYYPGGERALFQYLMNEINYPEPAFSANVQGRVTVSFIVEADGSISNAHVLKGIGFGADEEAVRVIEKMPKWEPATQNGRSVRVRYTLPIIFAITT